MNKFFKIIKTTEDTVRFSLEKPSKILVQNIHSNWLKFVNSKTQKYLPVFLNETEVNKENIPFGLIRNKVPEYLQTPMDHYILEHKFEKCAPNNNSKLTFKLVVLEQDEMQYFIQWQRYRKYWWSSITTTPSLFSIGDIKYGDKTAVVNIFAKFPWGQQTVETITLNSIDEVDKIAFLDCTLTLETGLFILLLDGLTSSSKDSYLRLHRTMAPYKISFALEDSINKQSLIQLATLMHHTLEENKISSLLPDFSLSKYSQMKENLLIGVAYTAVLSDTTLANGIFHLVNSSTMLKEHLHVADFKSYAALLCEK